MRTRLRLIGIVCILVGAFWQLGTFTSRAEESSELDQLRTKYLQLIERQSASYSAAELEAAIASLENTGKANPVVHFEIGCRDGEKTQKFYTDLFNWTIHQDGPIGMISTGSEQGIAGHISALGHEPHNYMTVYVEVDDIQAYLAKGEELGGKTMIPRTEVPGMGHFAWLNDLDGNIVGLWTPAAQ